MQLKKLEAYGFKSFADKIEVEFDKGITAIVGPNGSGKSNISDAIKWVMGEQNVRNLRGTKAEDIIFTGSSSRKPMGVAEVSLYFDNDGALPVDFNEVVVTRRLFRNGDSEFYINKSRCRLKDIIALFADTGIGHDSMGIISQNKIDEVLNARPEERRLFFEEAAGITKYRNRKRESLRKLEDTEANLLRVQDIIGEIENQLEPLKKSAAKTERYNQLQQELKSYKLAELWEQYKEIQLSREKQTAVIQEKKDQELAAATALQLTENRKEYFSKELLELEKELEQLNQRKNELKERIDSADSDVKVLEERRRQGKGSRQLLSQQIRELDNVIAEGQKDIKALETSEERDKSRQAEVRDKIAECRNKAKLLREELNMNRQEYNKAEMKYQTAQQSYGDMSGKLQMLEYDLTADQQRRGNRQKQLEEIEAGIGQHLAEQEKLQKDIAASKEQQSDKQALLAQAKAGLERTAAQESSVYSELRGLEKRQQNTVSRIQIMERLQQSYEGFGKAVKAVLKSQQAWSKGVCGAVAELLEVPGRYVTAIETSLGASLQNIVTEDTDTAKAAITYLKQERLGRVTFLPLSTITPRGKHDNVPQDAPGFLGWASELVGIAAQYGKVSEFLLGRTAVVDTLEHAIALARVTGQRLRIVTLEGELLSPGGAMSGGSRQHQESSFLNRGEEIRQLREQEKHQKARLQELQQKMDACAEKKLQQEKHISEFGDELHRQELQLREQEINLQQLAAGLLSLQQTKDAIDKEQSQEEQSVAATQKSIEELKDKLSSEKQGIEELESLLTELTNQYDDKDREADELAEYTNKLELEQTVLEQGVIRSREKILLLTRELARNSETVQTNRQEIAKIDNELESSQEQIGDFLSRIQRLEISFSEAKSAHKDVYDKRMERLVESQKNENEIKEARRRLNAIQGQLHSMELTASKQDFELEQCQERMLSEYGLVPERVEESIPNISPGELKSHLRSMTREVDALGVINPNAPSELKELQERHSFLAENADDLVAAKQDLEKIIGEMDTTMIKQFKEAFAKIDEYFGSIFVRLFGGGQAKIYLTDKDNVLESGVDITVQIPDKKRQNLSVLSGGERALTVVALLFSFLQYRPAPFSVLDEIDAPLDEANIGRFGSFLGEYAKDTQFIVVTHRKGTMESADTMYGVTVEDAGVSKVLSVKMKDLDIRED